MKYQLICNKTKDNEFIQNKTYDVVNGIIYTENDISFNTKEFLDVEDAIETLKENGYEFSSIREGQNNASNQKDNWKDKKENIQNLSNQILSEILKSI